MFFQVWWAEATTLEKNVERRRLQSRTIYQTAATKATTRRRWCPIAIIAANIGDWPTYGSNIINPWLWPPTTSSRWPAL